jgi:hypothetical protein
MLCEGGQFRTWRIAANITKLPKLVRKPSP